MKNIITFSILLLLALVGSIACQAGINRDTIPENNENYVLLEVGTPVSLNLYSEVSSARFNEGNIVQLEVKRKVIVNGREVIRVRDDSEGRVLNVRKAGMFGRPGILEIEAFSVRAVDGQMIPLYGPAHLEGGKKNSRKGTALGVSLAATAVGYGIFKEDAPVGAFGFTMTGLFVKGKEAIMDKEAVLVAYVAKRTYIKIN